MRHQGLSANLLYSYVYSVTINFYCTFCDSLSSWFQNDFLKMQFRKVLSKDNNTISEKFGGASTFLRLGTNVLKKFSLYKWNKILDFRPGCWSGWKEISLKSSRSHRASFDLYNVLFLILRVLLTSRRKTFLSDESNSNEISQFF